MSGWSVLRRLLGQRAPDGQHPVAEIPLGEKLAAEAEVRDYLERARAAARLARLQSKERP